MHGRRIALVAAVLSLCFVASASTPLVETAFAQEEGYAWGDGEAGSTGAATTTDDPLRILGFVGAGIGFRLLRNLDSPFIQDFLMPAYLDLGAAVYLPGRELRHGVGLALSTNMTGDASTTGIGPFRQWVFTPAYHLLLPFNRIFGMSEDMLALQLRVGIPLVIGQGLDNPAGVDFTFGGEVGVALHIKFLAGFGLYAEVQGDLIGGALDGAGNATVHPFLAVDAGFMIDYEVLP